MLLAFFFLHIYVCNISSQRILYYIYSVMFIKLKLHFNQFLRRYHIYWKVVVFPKRLHWLFGIICSRLSACKRTSPLNLVHIFFLIFSLAQVSTSIRKAVQSRLLVAMKMKNNN